MIDKQDIDDLNEYCLLQLFIRIKNICVSSHPVPD